MKLQVPIVRRSGDPVVLGSSGQESAQILRAAIEDIVAKELLVSLLCKFGILDRMAEELNADVLVVPAGSQIEQ